MPAAAGRITSEICTCGGVGIPTPPVFILTSAAREFAQVPPNMGSPSFSEIFLVYVADNVKNALKLKHFDWK